MNLNLTRIAGLEINPSADNGRLADGQLYLSIGNRGANIETTSNSDTTILKAKLVHCFEHFFKTFVGA